jgi:hypothetical protein
MSENMKGHGEVVGQMDGRTDAISTKAFLFLFVKNA